MMSTDELSNELELQLSAALDGQSPDDRATAVRARADYLQSGFADRQSTGPELERHELDWLVWKLRKLANGSL